MGREGAGGRESAGADGESAGEEEGRARARRLGAPPWRHGGIGEHSELLVKCS
jgi:hypothetical protein